jgi:flagellin-like hook-associated protein FlgL
VITGGQQSFPAGTGGATVALNVTTPIVPATGTMTANARLSLDGGATWTVVTSFASGAEAQVRDSATGAVVNVAVGGIGRTGTEELRFAGTFDVFTTLIAVRDTLQNAAGLPDRDVATRLSSLLAEIDFAHDAVLDGARDLGDRTQQVEMLRNRVQSLDVATQDALSRIADADFAESVLAIQRQEFGYEAALRVGARILETSLLDYLR